MTTEETQQELFADEDLNPIESYKQQRDAEEEEKQDDDVEEEKPEDDPKDEKQDEEEEKPEEKPEVKESPFVELARKLYPDDEVTDENTAEKLNKYIEDTKKKDQKLVDIVNSSPDFADLMYLMGQGATYEQAHGFVMGETEEDLDQAKDQWAKAAKERQAQKAEQQKAIQEINSNFDESFKTIDKYAKDNGLSKDDTDNLLQQIDGIVKSITEGRITPDILDKFHKGVRYEKDIQDAKDTSEVRGRNDAITQMKNKKKAEKGDGLPHPDSAATGTPDEQEDGPEKRIVDTITSWAQDRKF